MYISVWSCGVEAYAHTRPPYVVPQILQRQYSMYQPDTDVKILKNPKKKNNVTTRKSKDLPAIEMVSPADNHEDFC